MAVAGEAEVEAEPGEIVAGGEELEGAREAEPQLIPVERHPFDLLKDLGEINGRAADFGRDFGEGPAAREVAGQDEFHAVHETLAGDAGGGGVGGARSQGTQDEGQCQAFGFQRLGNAVTQAVAQEGDEGLGSRVDAQALVREHGRGAGAEKAGRRHFEEQLRADGQGKAGVASGNGMADAIAFAGVEEEDLIGFGDGLIVAEVADPGSAIGEDELDGGGVFLGAATAVSAPAVHIAHANGGRSQEEIFGEFLVGGVAVRR